MVSATISVVRDDAAGEASVERRLGRLDDARATVARLMALARRLVREYPDNANSYCVLSYGYNEIKKNAIRTRDDKLVLGSLVQSVECAQRALALEPDRSETRRHLDKLTEQLATIRAEQKAEGPPAQ
jgi:hypothetical protein